MDLGSFVLHPVINPFDSPARKCSSTQRSSKFPPISTSNVFSGVLTCQSTFQNSAAHLSRYVPSSLGTRITFSKVPRSIGSSSSEGSTEDSISSKDQKKASFGYSRKDVLLIGLGVGLFGFCLKSGLEFVGVDSVQAGNVVQLVVVLGMTVGWIFTYIFRVSNKDMTYAQQLRDYENKVMQKRLESLTEGELEALLEQVEEEKTRAGAGSEQV